MQAQRFSYHIYNACNLFTIEEAHDRLNYHALLLFEFPLTRLAAEILLSATKRSVSSMQTNLFNVFCRYWKTFFKKLSTHPVLPRLFFVYRR
jgi:hypothetical protein